MLEQNTMLKNNLGKNGLIVVYSSTSQFVTEGSEGRNSNRAGTWKQELMQRPRRSSAYWLTPSGSQDHLPRGGTAYNGLVVPISIINQENALQTCLWINLVEVFS